MEKNRQTYIRVYSVRSSVFGGGILTRFDVFFYSRTGFFLLYWSLFLFEGIRRPSVFGAVRVHSAAIRVYSVVLECIRRPLSTLQWISRRFECIRQSARVYSADSSVFGGRVYSARQRSPKTYYLQGFREIRKTCVFEIKNPRCVRVYSAAIRVYSADHSSVFGGIR